MFSLQIPIRLKQNSEIFTELIVANSILDICIAYLGGLLKLQRNQISINGSVMKSVHFLWYVLRCCLCFASIFRTAFPSSSDGSQLSILAAHSLPHSSANIRTTVSNKEGKALPPHTHAGSLVHELISHLSFGLRTQIPLLSLGRALDRIAVFLKAKKWMEKQDSAPGEMCRVRAFTHCS